MVHDWCHFFFVTLVFLCIWAEASISFFCVIAVAHHPPIITILISRLNYANRAKTGTRRKQTENRMGRRGVLVSHICRDSAAFCLDCLIFSFCCCSGCFTNPQQSLWSSEGYFWLLYLEHISESLLSYFYLSKESWISASTFLPESFSHTHLYFYLSEIVYFCRLRNSSTECKILGRPAVSITSAFLYSLSERQIMKKKFTAKKKKQKKKVGCVFNRKVGLYLTPNTVHITAGHFLVHGAR